MNESKINQCLSDLGFDPTDDRWDAASATLQKFFKDSLQLEVNGDDHATTKDVMMQRLGITNEIVDRISKPVQDEMNELLAKNGSYSPLEMLVAAAKLCDNQNEFAWICYKIGGYLESQRRRRPNPMIEAFLGILGGGKHQPESQPEPVKPAMDTKIAD